LTHRIRRKILPAFVLALALIALTLFTGPTAGESLQTPMQASSTTSTSQSNTTTPANQTSFLDPITAPVVKWAKAALGPYMLIPEFPPLFTIAVAAALALMSAVAGKLLVDYDMVRSTMREGQQWRKDIEKAKKANNEQELAKLMKKQQAMAKVQARASMEQMKVTAVTFVPFLVIWYLLSAVFQQHIVAVAPFPLPLAGSQLTFFSWYLISSFAVNLPIMRLFGIGMGDS